MLAGCSSFSRRPPVVLMTDFGQKDGAVSAMKGVAYTVSDKLVISDLTHEIEPFDIWAASYRLQQTFKYWPTGTVFVVVVDPGVGSGRKSIVAKSRTGHYFVGPDNGVFTLVGDDVGWEEVRALDESAYRRKGSEKSNTFHGRDLYAYVGAQLADGQLKFSGLGEVYPTDKLVVFSYQKPVLEKGMLKGSVPVLDSYFGNVWTNIPRELLISQFPNARRFRLRILNGTRRVYEGTLPLVDTFSGVREGAPLLYFNSLFNLSVALNRGNFAKKYRIESGPRWTVEILPK